MNRLVGKSCRLNNIGRNGDRGRVEKERGREEEGRGMGKRRGVGTGKMGKCKRREGRRGRRQSKRGEKGKGDRKGLGKGEKKGKWRVIKEEGGEDRGKREKGEVNMGRRESLLLVIVFPYLDLLLNFSNFFVYRTIRNFKFFCRITF